MFVPGMFVTIQGCLLPSRNVCYHPGMLLPSRNVCYHPGMFVPGMSVTIQGCLLPSRDVCYHPGMFVTIQECLLPSRDVCYHPGMFVPGVCSRLIRVFTFNLFTEFTKYLSYWRNNHWSRSTMSQLLILCIDDFWVWQKRLQKYSTRVCMRSKFWRLIRFGPTLNTYGTHHKQRISLQTYTPVHVLHETSLRAVNLQYTCTFTQHT